MRSREPRSATSSVPSGFDQHLSGLLEAKPWGDLHDAEPKLRLASCAVRRQLPAAGNVTRLRNSPLPARVTANLIERVPSVPRRRGAPWPSTRSRAVQACPTVSAGGRSMSRTETTVAAPPEHAPSVAKRTVNAVPKAMRPSTVVVETLSGGRS